MKQKNNKLILEIKNLAKSFKNNSETLSVLKDVNLEVYSGEAIAIMGPSGTGKSTLLNIIALILSADTGRIEINGKNILDLKDDEKAKLRAEFFGLVKQDYALLEDRSTFDNVALPLYFQNNIKKKNYKERVFNALKSVGAEYLLERNSRVDKFSGGEKQRIAIARSIVSEQKIILADEPTGSLDQEKTEQIAMLFKRLSKEYDKSIIIVTHDYELARTCDKIYVLNSGVLKREK